MKFTYKKLNFLFSNLITKESKKPLYIFSFLLLSTIIMHILFWLIHDLLPVNLWIHSSKTILMADLLEMGTDAGYFEHYQYILLFWCFLLSAYVVIKDKLYASLSIPFIYLFLFIDDSLSLHDYIFGPKIKVFFSNNNFLYLPDNLLSVFSEVSFWILVLISICFLSIPMIVSKSSRAIKFFKTNFIFFIALSFFAIFIDALVANYYYLIKGGSFVSYFAYMSLDLIEEAGELTSIALACIWLFGITIRSKNIINA